MKRASALGLVAGLSCCLLKVSPLAAQNTDGAFRLSLDGIVYSGEFATWATPVDPDRPAVELETTNTDVGLYAGSFGVGVGYAFNRNGVIGARLLHGSSESNVARDSEPPVTTSRFTLLPYAEFVAAGSPVAQPFFAGVVGFQSSSTKVGEEETSTSAFLFGFSAGVHLFPTDTFSIDPYLAYYRASGSVTTSSVDVDYSANTVLLGFSISGWIGGAGDDVPVSSDERPAVVRVTETREYAAPAEPAAARLRMAEEGGRLTGTVGLANGQLTLLGRPASDAESIVVRITVTADQNELASCRTGALIAGDHRSELEDMVGHTKAHGSQTIALLQGKAGSRELLTFTEAEDARIVLCGRIFAVHDPQRESVGQYFDRFKQLAIEAKTWEEAVPPPSVAPGPEAPPADTPPPASQPSAPSAAATSRSSAPPPQGAPAPSNAPAAGAPATPPAVPPPPSGSSPSTRSFDAP